MTAAPPRGSRVRPCARCGALNGADFDRCIRCGAALSALAVGAERVSGGLGRFIDGQRLLATKVLLGLTTLIFAGQLSATLAHRADPGLLLWGGREADLLRYGAIKVGDGVPPFDEPFRLLSACFVHFGLIHFGMNMLGLVNLARIAEPAIGAARFVITYVLTGIIGFAASVWWYTMDAELLDRGVRTAGASGAIFGIMGLILGILIRRRDPRWKSFAVQAVFYGLLFGFMISANNAAHVGGLVAGIAFGLVYGGLHGGRRRAEPLVNVIAALCLLACVASLALAQRSPRGKREPRRQELSLAIPLPDPGSAPWSQAGVRPVIATGRPTV